MTETIYSAEGALRHPARFLAAGREDLPHMAAVAWHLFRRNVRIRYRRTWLVYAWLLLPSVATTLLCVYITSRRIISIAAPELPYAVHVLAGMVLWQTFLDALNAPLQQFAAGRQLMTRSRVPLEALVLAGVFEGLLNCGVRLLVLGAVLFAYGVPMSASLLLAPLGLAALTLLGLAIGVILAPVGLLYEDVGRAVTMTTGVWFFLTPVVYPAPAEGLLRYNPVTPLLETTRAWLTSTGPASDGFGLVAAAATVLLLVGWALLRLARPHVVERLG